MTSERCQASREHGGGGGCLSEIDASRIRRGSGFLPLLCAFGCDSIGPHADRHRRHAPHRQHSVVPARAHCPRTLAAAMSQCELCSASTDLFCFVHQTPLCFKCASKDPVHATVRAVTLLFPVVLSNHRPLTRVLSIPIYIMHSATCEHATRSTRTPMCRGRSCAIFAINPC